MRFSILVCCLAILFVSSCRNVRVKERSDWMRFFQAEELLGSFELYDNNKEIAYYSDKEGCSERVSPQSTFLILSALAALESATAPTEQMVIGWNGEKSGRDEWDQDLSLTEAFRLSSTPFFEELNRRVGRPQMQAYLDSAKYGNMDMGADNDRFWLDGTLKITPDEQVGLMKRLYHHEISGFSERSQRIARALLFQEEGSNYRLYFKSDPGHLSADAPVSWLVGFVEVVVPTKNPKTKEINDIPHPYFFALKVEKSGDAVDLHAKKVRILKSIFKDLNITLKHK